MHRDRSTRNDMQRGSIPLCCQPIKLSRPLRKVIISTMTSEHSGEANTRAISYINRAMESLWLAAAFIVPLAMAPSDWMVSQFGLPKVAVLRTLVSFMVVLWLVEWAISTRDLKAIPPSGLLRAFSGWVRQEPIRWIHVAAAVFMSFYVLSSILSASVRISVWGGFTLIDGFSLYNMVVYYLLFLVLATHLRTKAQLLRLFGVSSRLGA
jgi:hypothetical protein